MAKRSSTSIERRLRVAAALLAASGAAACSDSATANARSASQLAFSLGSPTASTAATAASAAVVPVTKNGHTLDLTQVSVTIERAKLKPVHDAVCAGDDDANEQGDDEHHTGSSEHGDDDCPSLKVGPTTIALPLTGNVVTVPADALPAGTFHELEVRISQLHLVGTFDGQAFDVTLPVGVRTEIEFETPLVVTAGTATSITVNVPVADWLVNTDGSLIDPSKVASNSSLLTQIRNRIAASLHAFEDRDHDGHDDHHGHG
jgi:hypothetical protein